MIDFQLFHSDILEHIFLKLDEETLKKIIKNRSFWNSHAFLLIALAIMLFYFILKLSATVKITGTTVFYFTFP